MAQTVPAGGGRGEPSPSLFEIPSDFTVEDANVKRDVIFRRMVK